MPRSQHLSTVLSPSAASTQCVSTLPTQQLIDKVKEKIVRVHLLTNLFIYGERTSFITAQLGSNNSHGETIWLMVTEEIVLIRQSK